MPKLDLRDGDRLHYEVRGEGPSLLLVSGLSGTAAFWNLQVPVFAQHFKIVLHDHRGTGKSGASRIDYSVEQMTDDLVQLMDHLEIDRAHLIGHSTGGAIGQTLALDHPDRLDRLVLSATWTTADGYLRRLFDMRKELLRSGGPAAYVRSSALITKPTWWIRDHIQELDEQQGDAERRLAPPEILLSRIAAIMRFDRVAELHRIGAPTLVIAARDDLITPCYYSEELGRLIPHALTIILPQGGHFYPHVVPDHFEREVMHFLTSRQA